MATTYDIDELPEHWIEVTFEYPKYHHRHFDSKECYEAFIAQYPNDKLMQLSSRGLK